MSYQLMLHTPHGAPLAMVSAVSGLAWARREREVGTCAIAFLPNINPAWLSIDGRVEVLRRAGGRAGYRRVDETQWLIRKIEYSEDEQGRYLVRVEGEDLVGLLARAVVAYTARGTASQMYLPADDMLKEIVRDNLAQDAAAGRLRPYISVAANVSAAPTIRRDFAFKNVHTLLNDICEASEAAGTYLTYDFVRLDSQNFEFRTYTGQRGVDRSSTSGQMLLFSKGAGNLAEPSLIYDHSREVTAVYASGSGTDDARKVQVATDATRIALSPFGRIEKHIAAAGVKAGDANEDALILAEATSELERGRARRFFSGKVTETPSCIYGEQFHLGDLVTASFRGQTFDCRVIAAGGSYEAQNKDGQEMETLNIRIASEDSL